MLLSVGCLHVKYGTATAGVVCTVRENGRKSAHVSTVFFFLSAFGMRRLEFTVVKPREQGADVRVITMYFHHKDTVRLYQFGEIIVMLYKHLLPLEWTKNNQIYHV